MSWVFWTFVAASMSFSIVLAKLVYLHYWGDIPTESSQYQEIVNGLALFPIAYVIYVFSFVFGIATFLLLLPSLFVDIPLDIFSMPWYGGATFGLAACMLVLLRSTLRIGGKAVAALATLLSFAVSGLYAAVGAQQ